MKWPEIEIGRLCLTTEQEDPRDKPDESFAYIDISSIDKDLKEISQTQSMLGCDAPSRARKIVREGDVLVSTVRPNLNAVAVVPDSLNQQIASTGFCVLRANPKHVVGKYLFYRALTPDFVGFLTARMRGANYPAVTDAVVRDAPIPWPTIREQRRIVEILDQADAIRKQHGEANAKAGRILSALFYEMFGDPATNQKSWPVFDMETLCTKVTDGTHDTPKPVEEGFYLITNKHFLTGRIDFSKAYRISARDHAIVIARSKPEFGDVLYSQIGTLGIACFVDTSDEFSIKNCALFKPDLEKISGRWLTSLLNYDSFQKLVLKKASGGLQKYLSLETLRKLVVPVPPLSLQRDFEAIANRVLKILDQRRAVGCTIEKLFMSLLGSAFSGDLTAKWREAHMRELLVEAEQQSRVLARAGRH